jgi:pleiotropic regulator 1
MAAAAPPAEPAAPPAAAGELPIQGKTVKALTLLSLKRTHDLFVGNHGQKVPLDEEAQKAKIACKMRDEYSGLQGFKPREAAVAARGAPAAAAKSAAAAAAADSKSHTAKLIDSIPTQRPAAAASQGKQLVVHGGGAAPGQISAEAKAALTGTIMIPTAAGGQKEYTPSAAIARRLPSKWPRPAWHAPWRMYRVISGHLGYVPTAECSRMFVWVPFIKSNLPVLLWQACLLLSSPHSHGCPVLQLGAVSGV